MSDIFLPQKKYNPETLEPLNPETLQTLQTLQTINPCIT
jgi:hypothetical protein